MRVSSFGRAPPAKVEVASSSLGHPPNKEDRTPYCVPSFIIRMRAVAKWNLGGAFIVVADC